MERGLLAKVGALAFAGALVLPAILSAAGAQASMAMAALAVDLPVAAQSAAFADAPFELPEMAPPVARDLVFVASSALEPPPQEAIEPAQAAVPVVIAPPAPLPPPEPVITDGVVLASWYGPGFYGNRTACGQTYTPEMVGVAHRTLPCGTRVSITSPGGVTVVAAVIDRGPFVTGRSLDLSGALKLALGCGDLCRVRMTVMP